MTSKKQGGNLGLRDTAFPRAGSVLTCAITSSSRNLQWGAGWFRFFPEL